MNTPTRLHRTPPKWRGSLLLSTLTVSVAALATGLLLLIVASMPVPASLPRGNGEIAFTNQRDGNEEIYVMNSDGTGQTRLTQSASTTSTSSAGRDLLPSFLPGGGRVAFTSRRPVENIHPDGGIDEVYLMDTQDRDGVPEGDNLTRLTGDAEGMRHNFGAAFSADGKKVVFVGAWNGMGTNEIYVTDFVDADGTNPAHLLTESVRQLTNNALIDRFPAISPDGAKIAFSRREGTDDIWVMNADGTGQTNITNAAGNDLHANFSPDGTEIVFSSNRRASDGTVDSEIYVMNADGSNPRPITNNSVTDESPVFSPDGTKIAFTSSRNGNITGDLNNINNKEIWVMNDDGSGPVRLTNNSVEDSDPDWGPDTTAPSTRARLSEEANANGWHREDVTVSLDAEDQGGAGVYKVQYESGPNSAQNVPETTVLAGQLPAQITINAEGTTTLNYFATDNTGNVESPKSLTVNLDKTRPQITVPSHITAVATGPSGAAVEFAATATDNTDGDLPVSYETKNGSVASGDTFPLGTSKVTATAADKAGNIATVGFDIAVIYDFQGFFSPVDNPGSGPEYVVNRAKAGSAVPVKFGLGGNQGTTVPEVFAESPNSTTDNPLYYPVSRQIPTDLGASADPIEETVNAGSSGLSYDPLTDQYTYVWKTDKSWGANGGQDRELILKLADGTRHTALFRFTK